MLAELAILVKLFTTIKSGMATMSHHGKLPSGAWAKNTPVKSTVRSIPATVSLKIANEIRRRLIADCATASAFGNDSRLAEAMTVAKPFTTANTPYSLGPYSLEINGVSTIERTKLKLLAANVLLILVFVDVTVRQIRRFWNHPMVHFQLS